MSCEDERAQVDRLQNESSQKAAYASMIYTVVGYNSTECRGAPPIIVVLQHQASWAARASSRLGSYWPCGFKRRVRQTQNDCSQAAQICGFVGQTQTRSFMLIASGWCDSTEVVQDSIGSFPSGSFNLLDS
jgi:hypothetical protein